jgi:EAL domain-containing protein (putative c-di-GMP-specific phosphodiesterase class I)
MSSVAQARPRSSGAAEHDRFVAFAFAGANLVVEIDAEGVVAYAAGSFRTEFGSPPEAFLGRRLRDLVAPVDQGAVDAALWLLVERGRLLPMTIRLGNAQRTPLALAGLVLPSARGPQRLCLTFSPLPMPPSRAAPTMRTLTRATEAKLRSGEVCELGLIELVGPGAAASNEAVAATLQALAPESLTGEIGPGRFGLLGAGGGKAELMNVAALLEKALQGQGMDVRIASSPLSLATDGLTPIQAAHALRQALTVFAREGGAGLGESGFTMGLAGHLKKAGVHANALRRAIKDGNFGMAYQPIVGLSDGAVHHYEALIRPRPIPDVPLPTPQDFILLVETLGMANELDLMVAQVACDAAAKSGAAVAFNLSGQSAQSPAFRKRLLNLLAHSPAATANLMGVEMTETADIEDIDEAARTADALREMRVPFCLDDFGAGAADVRVLRRLGADIVKLDGSYIPGVAEPGRERAFAAGMVEIARAAGAEIVAEHVETEADAVALQAMGVQYGQGWLFGRPGALPGDSVAADRPVVARRRGVQERWG